MRLSQKAIKEFKEVYYEEFKEEISNEEAQETGEFVLIHQDGLRPILRVRKNLKKE